MLGYKASFDKFQKITIIWNMLSQKPLIKIINGGGVKQEFGINTYTVLYKKQVNNEDLLYSTGNYIQYNNK